MRVRVVLLVLSLMAATMAGCIPAKAGARCRTNEWGDDGTYALKCENGRWVRKGTKAQIAQLLIAIAKSRQTTTTTAASSSTTTTLRDDAGPPTTLDPHHILQLSASYRTACALITGAGVRCWGDNSNSQVRGNGFPSATATPYFPEIYGATSVTAGVANSCAIVAGGQVKCWGINTHGELGDNSTTARLAPVTVVDSAGNPITGATQVSIGHSTSCALVQPGGSVMCWGENDYGQLASGGTTESHFARAVLTGPSTPLGNATSIASGNRTSCAVLANTQAWCWGLDDYGQVGNNSLTPPTSAVYARAINDNSGGIARTGIISIAVGDSHTCAVSNDGSVRCWGYGAAGALGHGSDTSNYNYPAGASQVQAGASTFLTGAVSVTAGSNHTCATLASGAVTCWGSNGGQFSNGTTSYSTPFYANATAVVPGTVVATAAGGTFQCFANAAEQVWCSGSNSFGQLGAPGPAQTSAVLVDLNL